MSFRKKATFSSKEQLSGTNFSYRMHVVGTEKKCKNLQQQEKVSSLLYHSEKFRALFVQFLLREHR